MMWDAEKLWAKSCLYMQRAFAEDSDSDLLPLWSSLGLELLARSALARIHPSLLADPQDGANILYACGFPSSSPPRSIPMKATLLRCQAVFKNFTKDEVAFCTTLIEARNTELHTGELAFQNFTSEKWLPEFFKCCDVLAASQGKTLNDLFGPEVGNTAVKTIEAAKREWKERAKALIADAKKVFSAVNVEERLMKLREGILSASKMNNSTYQIVMCPACEGKACIRGEVSRHLEPKITDEFIVQRAVLMPSQMECLCCSLTAKGYNLMHALGFGSEWTIEQNIDPQEYYGVEPDDDSYDDYGND
jgi:hypothetical protein